MLILLTEAVHVHRNDLIYIYIFLSPHTHTHTHIHTYTFIMSYKCCRYRFHSGLPVGQRSTSVSKDTGKVLCAFSCILVYMYIHVDVGHVPILALDINHFHKFLLSASYPGYCENDLQM